MSEEKSPWIRIEDRLPENETAVIVAFINKVGNHVGWGYYKDFKFYDNPDFGDSTYDLVTNWCPLPDYPKK